MNPERLLHHFDTISEAPDAVARLRRLILDLAVRGKLVEQEVGDEPASALLERIQMDSGVQAKCVTNADPFETRPFELPDSWVWCQLGELSSLITSGSRDWAKHYSSSGAIFVRMGNLSRDSYRLRMDTVQRVTPPAGGEGTRTQLQAGDVLLSITGEVGLLGLIPDNFGEAFINQHTCLIRPVVQMQGRFMPEFLRSSSAQAQFNEPQRGLKNSFRLSDVSKIWMPLPPPQEQHRIVAKVDELMALCDLLQAARDTREQQRNRLVAASLHRLTVRDIAEGDDWAELGARRAENARFHLQHLPRLSTRHQHIKQLRQTILNLAVRGRLVPQDPKEKSPPLSRSMTEVLPHELPLSWCFSRLVNLLAEDTRNGYSRRPDDAADGTPILRISAGTVRRDGIVAEEEHKLISGIDPEARLQFGLRSGDLLACRFNGNKAFVGRLTIFNDYLGIRPIYPDKLIRVRVDAHLVLPSFIQIAGGTDIVRGEVEDACATTVGNWGISASNLKQVRFPVPPLPEQHRIVAKVDELMALCDQLESSLASTQVDRARLLDSLLHEAMAPAPHAVALPRCAVSAE